MEKYLKLAFSHIPGYRSNEKANKIIATIYYLGFTLFLIISLLLKVPTAQALKLFIAGITLPFILFLLTDRASKNF
ncbi:MAG: hypothetical protein ACRC41_16900 [Sarcina sp.]